MWGFSSRIYILKLSVAIAFAYSLSGCRAGGNLASQPEVAQVAPTVEIPTIASPSQNPYYSKDSALSISGMCMTGDTVRLRGAQTDSKSCVNSSYTFVVSATSDSVYSYIIDQVDANNNISLSVGLTWVRQSSVPVPTILWPPASPFSSSQNSLILSGACQTNATINLTGGATGSQVCLNSQFSFTIPKTSDGTYTIQVEQKDPAGNTASTAVTWIKQNLVPTPSSPTLVVGTQQTFTFAGGSGTYFWSLLSNNSGATLSSNPFVYTAGHTAGVVDVIQIRDSLGATYNVNVSTTADVPDHLEVSDGNNQSMLVGSQLAISPKVKVVDKYGNAISNFKVLFQKILGDGSIVSSPLQTTDASGLASVVTRLGNSSIINTYAVTPVTSALPDVTATGKSTLLFSETGTVNATGVGTFGLYFKTVTNPGSIIYGNFGHNHGDNTHRDLAILNTGGANISVLLNQGNGTFSSANYNVCSGPNSITSGDFNGDGNLDLAVSCISGFVSILLGNSDGTFQSALNISTVAGPVSIAAADFRQNGKIDLAVASATVGNIGIHYGNGDGTFSSANMLSNTSNLAPIQIAVGKLNADNYPDIVIVNGGSQNNISVLLNKADGSGTFNANSDYVAGTGPSSVAIGDFDSSGINDLAVANYSDGSVSIFSNNGDGTFQAKNDITVGANPTQVLAVDLQGSHFKKDLIVINSGDNNVGVLLNNTAGASPLSFDTMVTLSYSTLPTQIALTETNGDAHPDLIASIPSNPSAIEVRPGLGGAVFGPYSSTGTNPVTGTLARLVSGDSNQYLIVANQGSNNISILRQNSNGLFSAFSTLATGTSPVAVATADLNEDGNPDIIVVNRGSNSISVFISNGDGTFKTRADYSVGNSPSGIAVGDFNRDGHIDLAISNLGSNSVTILPGKGDGTFASSINVGTGANPSAIVAGDFNGDRIIDLAVTNSTDGTVGVLLGNGDGTFQTHIPYTVGGVPTALIVNDFTGDGIADLAALNSGDSSITILKGRGDGSFSTKSTIVVNGASMQKIAAGDFHGAGKLDLVATNGDNTYALMRGHGDGTFDAPVTIVTADSTSAYFGVIAVDVNFDGVLDLLLFDNNNSRVETWIGQ